MSREMLYYRKYTHHVKRLLTLYGLFPHQQSIVKYLPILQLILYCFVFFTMINFIRIHIANISAIVGCFSLFASLTHITIKVVQFFLRREKLAHIHDTLETLFKETAMKQPSSSPVCQYLLPCYRLFCYQFICLFATSVLYATKPLISDAIRHANRSLSLPAVYPWPVVSTASFVAHNLFEAYILLSFCLITPGVDAFFTLCSFRMCSVFRTMAVELEELPKQPYPMENREQLLRKCIERHTALIECGVMLQEIYAPIVLSVTLTNCLGMCALIFEVLRAENIPLEKVIGLSLYLCGKIIQILAYAWPGDIVTSEDEAFRREVYYNDWYEHSNTRITKLYIMILSQKLMVLKAYNLLVISMDLFAKIMNSTISYYFFLVTLDDAE
ncbi:uncharacterized protein LOC143352331 isoform X3 [Halictus rubicundus]|uniref:uncharacterized protein LOC143352331 isoform X3 n=1 Tax=Halictus rubicundus TaxID=77578 RepID=UPI004034F927